jgi:hypothetical protein
LASPDEQAAQLKDWIEADLLVRDDLFLARRIADVSAQLLQALVHQRYKLRRAIVITSNRVVQDWGKYLGDATMATTILDRLMHRCAKLEFAGKSCRLKEVAVRIAIHPESSQSDRPAWRSLGSHKWGKLKWPSGRASADRREGWPSHGGGRTLDHTTRPGQNWLLHASHPEKSRCGLRGAIPRRCDEAETKDFVGGEGLWLPAVDRHSWAPAGHRARWPDVEH